MVEALKTGDETFHLWIALMHMLLRGKVVYPNVAVNI